MKREYRIKVNDMRPQDVFVRWPEEELGSEREVYVLRERPLPTKVGSRIRDNEGSIFVLSNAGFWISLRTGIGHEKRMFEGMEWSPYLPEVSEEMIYDAICKYADYVSKHNGFNWLTAHGRRRFAEEIAKELKNA